MKIINFADKKIGILGYGIENQALLLWLVKQGAKNITICDKNSNIKSQITNKIQISKLKFQIGEDYLNHLEQFNIIFRTPGIPYLSPEIQKALRHSSGQAKRAGVEVSSQIKLFMDLCPCKTIGITGTKGKGTTTSLIFEILKKNFQFPISNFQTNSKFKIPNSKQIYLAGNIGNPPIEFLDKLTKDDLVILELSSFQLQDLEKSPNIAVVLDIKSDHLDYHKNQKEYVEAKENIVRYQNRDDFSIINLDYLSSFGFAELTKANKYYFSRKKSVDQGAYVEWTEKGKGAHFGKIILRTEKKDFEICKTYDVTLRGEHNLENICAAITASYLAGANIDAIKKVVPKFKGLEHRLEFVKDINGIKFYNDSFSTTPDTTVAAIKSFPEPIILIVGGSEKGADYTNLGREINKSSVKTLIAIGVTGPKIVQEVRSQELGARRKINIIQNLKSIPEIIKSAIKESEPGDVVLLSPASASFDMFKNYKDRGNQFKEEVKKIM